MWSIIITPMKMVCTCNILLSDCFNCTFSLRTNNPFQKFLHTLHFVSRINAFSFLVLIKTASIGIISPPFLSARRRRAQSQAPPPRLRSSSLSYSQNQVHSPSQQITQLHTPIRQPRLPLSPTTLRTVAGTALNFNTPSPKAPFIQDLKAKGISTDPGIRKRNKFSPVIDFAIIYFERLTNALSLSRYPLTYLISTKMSDHMPRSRLPTHSSPLFAARNLSLSSKPSPKIFMNSRCMKILCLSKQF
jgi:hypothetical protein